MQTWEGAGPRWRSWLIPGQECSPGQLTPNPGSAYQLLPYKEGQHPARCVSPQWPSHTTMLGQGSVTGLPQPQGSLPSPQQGRPQGKRGRHPCLSCSRDTAAASALSCALTEGRPVCDPTVHRAHQSHGSDPSRPLAAAPALSQQCWGAPAQEQSHFSWLWGEETGPGSASRHGETARRSPLFV